MTLIILTSIKIIIFSRIKKLLLAFIRRFNDPPGTLPPSPLNTEFEIRSREHEKLAATSDVPRWTSGGLRR